MPETSPMQEKCTCKKCHLTFVPSFAFDFYPDESGDGGLCERCMMTEIFASEMPRGEPSILPPGYETSVCKMGLGAATCSFLGITGSGPRCLKGSDLEGTVRKKLEAGSMASKGDNCSGPPDFKVS